MSTRTDHDTPLALDQHADRWVDRILGVHSFLDTARWFPLFGLPDHPDEVAA